MLASVSGLSQLGIIIIVVSVLGVNYALCQTLVLREKRRQEAESKEEEELSKDIENQVNAPHQSSAPDQQSQPSVPPEFDDTAPPAYEDVVNEASSV